MAENGSTGDGTGGAGEERMKLTKRRDATSEIREATEQFVAGKLALFSYQDWLVRFSMTGFSDSSAERISNRIEGILAEASHSDWQEEDIREEVANAIRAMQVHA